MRATALTFGPKSKPLEAKNRLEDQSFVEEGGPWLKASTARKQQLDEEAPRLASPSSQTAQQGCTSLPVTSVMGIIMEFIFSQFLKAVTLGLLVVSFNWNGSLFGVKNGDVNQDIILSGLDQLKAAIHNQRLEDMTTAFPIGTSSAELILMQDFALISSGAFHIPPLTSTFDTTQSAWHMWRRAPDQHSFQSNSADIALTAGGNCWRIPRARGHLGIGFKKPVIITHISIEHHPSQSMNAPRDIVLWGFVEQMDNLQRYILVDQNVDDQPPQEVIEASRKQNPAGSFIKLAHLEYSPFHNSPVQTFSVHENVLRSGFDFGLVVVEIRGNWGGDETCLYRV